MSNKKDKKPEAPKVVEETKQAEALPEEETPPTLEEELKTKDEEIEKLKKELEEQKDQMLRRQADFENHKKRAMKQQETFKKLAIKDFAFEIININDDLLRAVEASSSFNKEEGDTHHSSFVEGVSMISKQIIETLEHYGIEEIEALNKPFDPNVHEAVEMEDSEDHEVDTVTKVHQKGFKLDDLIIRTSKVKVSRAKPQKTENSENSEEE